MWRPAAAKVQQEQQAQAAPTRPQGQSEWEKKLATFTTAPTTQHFKQFEGKVLWLQLPSKPEQQAFFDKLTEIKNRGGVTVNDVNDPTITHFVPLIPGEYEPGYTFTDDDISEDAREPPGANRQEGDGGRFWNGDHAALDPYMDKKYGRTRMVLMMDWVDDVLSGKIKAGPESDPSDYQVLRRSSGPLRKVLEPPRPIAVKTSIDPRKAARPSFVTPSPALEVPSATTSRCSLSPALSSPRVRFDMAEQPFASVQKAVESDSCMAFPVVPPENAPPSPIYSGERVIFDFEEPIELTADADPAPRLEPENQTPVLTTTARLSLPADPKMVTLAPQSNEITPPTPDLDSSWPQRDNEILTSTPESPHGARTVVMESVKMKRNGSRTIAETSTNQGAAADHTFSPALAVDSQLSNQNLPKRAPQVRSLSTGGHKRALSVQPADGDDMKIPRLSAMLPHRRRVVTDGAPSSTNPSFAKEVRRNFSSTRPQHPEPKAASATPIVQKQPDFSPPPEPTTNTITSPSTPREIGFRQSTSSSSPAPITPSDSRKSTSPAEAVLNLAHAEPDYLPSAEWLKRHDGLDPDLLYCAKLPGVRRALLDIVVTSVDRP